MTLLMLLMEMSMLIVNGDNEFWEQFYQVAFGKRK